MHLFEAPVDSITIKIISTESFDTELEGSDVTVRGIVIEQKITKDDLAEMEEEYQIGCDGSIEKEDGHEKMTEEELEHKKETIEYYKALIDESGKDYIAFYSLECIENKLKE